MPRTSAIGGSKLSAAERERLLAQIEANRRDWRPLTKPLVRVDHQARIDAYRGLKSLGRG